MTDAPVIRVLFVCLGNICRSPMAEAIFRHKVARASLAERFHIDSAGTGDWHIGEPAHIGTRRELEKNGVSSGGLVARQLAVRDLQEHDYILAMDRANLRGIRQLGEPTGTLRLILAYAPQLGEEVPDPWFTGEFSETFRLLDQACDALLEAIVQEAVAIE